MREIFLKYLQYEKRYSPHTITSYKNDLTRFEEYLFNSPLKKSSLQADHRDVRSWIVHLVDSGLNAKSINRKIASLRSYYKFLLSREGIKHDPMQKVRALKTSKRLPQFVNENDMNRLLDHCTFDDNLEGRRDRLVMELLYGTGTRLSELLTLTHHALDLSNRTIKVLGKRNKERVIPFTVGLGTIIGDYIDHKKREGIINDQDLLIVTNKGQSCYPMMIYRTVKKYLDQYTTIEKRSPHVLRHTFATHLLNKGAELNAVKDLLGHTSLAATQVYTHNSLDKLKSTFDQAHPKAL